MQNLSFCGAGCSFWVQKRQLKLWSGGEGGQPRSYPLCHEPLSLLTADLLLPWLSVVRYEVRLPQVNRWQQRYGVYDSPTLIVKWVNTKDGIRSFFQSFVIRNPLKDIKFHKNQRPKISFIHSFNHFISSLHFFFTTTINLGESYLVPHYRLLTWGSRTSYLACDDQSLRSFTVGGGAQPGGSIKRGLGTERARLGTFRGFGT